jgi:hypothetical protein
MADLAVTVNEFVYEPEAYSSHMSSIPFVSIILDVARRFCLFPGDHNDPVLLDFYSLDFNASRARRTQCTRHVLLPKTGGAATHARFPELAVRFGLVGPEANRTGSTLLTYISISGIDIFVNSARN